MIDLVLSGVLLGLSTGIFCLASCAPVFVPFMMAEDRPLRRNLFILGELAAGRLCAYLLVGGAIGFLAGLVETGFLKRIAGAALVAVSLLLLFFVLGKRSPEPALCRILTSRGVTVPIFFGFLTGINVCPPFLLAISAAIAAGSVTGSMLLFFGFFCGTSVYLFVLLPVGLAGRYETIRTVGRVTAVLSGVLFLIIGIMYLL
ncbi:MAG: sulfite exporter TauE/SafE family protein [Methanoregula sp.]